MSLTRNDCYLKKAADKLRGKKDSKKPAAASAAAVASQNQFTNHSYAMMARHGFPGDSDDWFIDSGATDHICFDKNSFSIYHSLIRPKPIYLGDYSVVNTYGMGTIRIGDKVNLFNVLHVPDLDTNLLSVDKVLQQDHDVLFSGDGGTIKQGNRNIIKVFRAGKLFRVDGMARKRMILHSGDLSLPVSLTPEPAD